MIVQGKQLNPEFVLLASLIELCQRDIVELTEEKPRGWKSACRRIKRNMREVNEMLNFVSAYE